MSKKCLYKRPSFISEAIKSSKYGKAGTGKNRLLGEIVRECRARGKIIAVAAPTGIAEKNRMAYNHLIINKIQTQHGQVGNFIQTKG